MREIIYWVHRQEEADPGNCSEDSGHCQTE